MQQLASGLWIPDTTDRPNLKQLFDPNWTLLDGVLPDGNAEPIGIGHDVNSAVAGTKNARATPYDHVHIGRAFGATGFGMGSAQQKRFAVAGVSTAVTTAYTAPAATTGLSAVQGSLVYLYNSTAAAITVLGYVGTANSTGNQCRSQSIPANSVVTWPLPPLAPGDSFYVSAGAAGINLLGTVYECYEPGWVVAKLSAVAANTQTRLYTPSAGKSARQGPYVANITSPLWNFSPTAGTIASFWKVGAAASFEVSANAVAANAATAHGPIDQMMNNGDALYVSNTVAGSNFWGLFFEF